MTSPILPTLDEETLDMISKLTKLDQRKKIVVWGGGPGFITSLARCALNSEIKVIPLNEKDAAAFNKDLSEFSDRISVLEPSSTANALPNSSIHLIIFSYLLYRHSNPLTILNEVIRLLSATGLLLIIDYRAIPLREYVGLIRKRLEGKFPDESIVNYATTNRYSTEDIGILLDQKSFMILKCISWRERQVLVVAQHW
ncbi:MAG: hypothetical protein ACFFCQ_00585 [Promethearchaeota archaeon]